MTIEFDLPGFAAHLASLVVREEAVAHAMLEKAARLVEREAKREIGVYQSQAGMFAPWQELADATKDDRVRKGYTENDPGLRSGDMRTSISYVIQGHTAHIGSNDDKLVRFELGTRNQPPRSVLGGSAFRMEAKIHLVLGGGYAAFLEGEGVHNGRLAIE